MKNDKHVLVTFHFRIISFFLIFIFLMSCRSNIHTLNRYFLDAKPPEQVVELFQKTFGIPRMDEIGPYTTESFRDNMPITVWINKTWNDLNQFDYDKIAFKLLDTKYDALKNRAKITVATKIKTKVGSATQKEIYLLIKEDDYWLIDDLVVTHEKVDEKLFGL